MLSRLSHIFLFWFIFLIILFHSTLYLFANGHDKQLLAKKSDVMIKKIEKVLENNRYLEAEALVKKAIKNDSTNIKLYLILSDISDELLKYEQKKWPLQKVIKLDSSSYPLAYKLLADIFFKEGNYKNALNNYNHLRKFCDLKDSMFLSQKINSCNFALLSLSQDRRIKITHLESNVNTSFQEYCPFISTDDSLLYFTRLIENEKKYAFERIFIAAKTDSGWSKSIKMNFSDNEDVNIGTLCLSSDGNFIFFTACGRNDSKGSCDIYYARKINNNWSQPLNVGSTINSNYWEAQPSISSDNQHLFFVSNRPGGIGGMDLWCSEVYEGYGGNLIFKTPVNLGKGVNSIKNDFSPFIHADGSTLYFASEGRYGMGGSDLFISKFVDSTWKEAVNLGYPINTRFNEDGLVVSPTSNIAVFSSNREGSIDGSKDLYQFRLPAEFLPEKVGYIRGLVYDSETGYKLQASIELTPLESNDSKPIISDRTDGFITALVSNKTYALNVDKEGYLFYSRHFNLIGNVGFKQAEHVDIYLEPIKAGKTFVLSNIFFDFDSDKLKVESDAELIQLADFLRKNSRLKVEISGHTDNIGSSEYNLKLSENRAKAIFDYLKQFIEVSQMIYKGYGSEIPIASNDSEQGRAQNRRSEIKILSY
jgi:outer membrane protein OmpA-like peptidoglycan-associated protein